ncbi:MAG TPA: ABC transporter ATP-binding protein [Armatimonadota bacterium]|nr:ABC transporter ATP-binding protein [Armatimonadota bacterium]
MAVPEAHESPAYFVRWLSYVLKHKSYFYIGLFTMITGMAIDAVWPKIVGTIIDRILLGHAMHLGRVTLPLLGVTPITRAFLAILGGLLVLLAVRALCNFTTSLSLTIVGEKVHLDIRQQCFDHLQKLPISYFDTSYTGRIMARITTDADALWRLLYNGTIDVLGKSLLIIVVLIILCRIHVGLTLFSLLVLPVLLFLSYRTRKRARVVSKAQREAIAFIYSRLQEIISGIRLIRVFSRGKVESATFARDLRMLYDRNLDLMRTYSELGAQTDFFTGATTAAILCFGGIAVAHHSISVGNLVSFYLYAGLMLTPLGVIVRSATEQFTNAGVAMERIFGLLDTAVAQELKGPNLPCPRLHGEISMEHLSFGYRTGHEILHDVSLQVAAGGTIAVVGPSGAGKSTLVNLLCRFYYPTQGNIFVDGNDIDQYEIESFRKQISYVSQDNFLFSGTILENLRFAKPDATKEEIEQAAQQANAHDFIRRLPKGYDTEIGERGVMLSGGQKQRLSLARALLRDPAILVLDEPTSALDAESESIILEALETMFQGRTRFIIAHRLSTVLSADTILVMDQGRIVQQGPHAQLLAEPGLYQELCHKQFIGTPIEGPARTDITADVMDSM